MSIIADENKNYRAIIIEWATLAGIVLGCFYVLHSDIKNLENRMEQRMLSQEARTDKLYEMFIELIQKNKEK